MNIRWQAAHSPTKRQRWHVVVRGCQVTLCGHNCLWWERSDRFPPKLDSQHVFCRNCWGQYERVGVT